MAAHSFPISPVGKKGWAMVAGALLAGCCALAAVSIVSAPMGLMIGLAATGSHDTSLSARIFDGGTAFAGARLLAGVNGETGASGPAPMPDTAEAAANALSEREVAPAALGRLSAGDCIALTTATGEKLFLRILGAQPTESGRDRIGSARVELAVTPCEPGNEVVLKAIIDSKTESRQSVIQRSL